MLCSTHDDWEDLPGDLLTMLQAGQIVENDLTVQWEVQAHMAGMVHFPGIETWPVYIETAVHESPGLGDLRSRILRPKPGDHHNVEMESSEGHP